MAKVLRVLRSAFGAKKAQLPKGLEFLKGVKFYAITKHNKDGRLQKRIEILPRNLKPLLELKNTNEDLERQVSELRESSSALQSDFNKLKADYGLLESNYNKLCENVKSETEPNDLEQKSPKNYFDVAEDKGFKPRGGLSPLQGGLPS